MTPCITAMCPSTRPCPLKLPKHHAAWYMSWYMSAKHIPCRKPFVHRGFSVVMVYGYMVYRHATLKLKIIIR